jgi:hypothetical protein
VKQITPIVVAFVLSGRMSVAAGDDWPQFRGPDGQGHADAAELPLHWNEQSNITWRTALPGEGHSSPVISGNQIWLTAALLTELPEEERARRLANVKNSGPLQLAGALKLQALCLDRESGAISRTITLFEVAEPQPKHGLNSYASPTPVIANGRVFCHFGSYGTAAIDCRSGEVLWRNETLRVDHQNGPGSSPVVWDNRLIIHFDGTDSQFIAALDTANGEVIWQTPRSGELNPTADMKKAYGTPLIVESPDRPLVISPAADWVYGYDARDGREVWRVAYGKLGFSTVPRPVVSGDTAFIATSFMQSRLLAVRFTGEGDVTRSHIRWQSDRQIPQKPSLVIVGERLYFVSDQGIVRSLKTETGEEVWFKRLAGDYSASPLASGERLYFFNQSGLCTVIRAADEYQVLAENPLDSAVMASPAVSGNSLFVRTATSLYRIDEH